MVAGVFELHSGPAKALVALLLLQNVVVVAALAYVSTTRARKSIAAAWLPLALLTVVNAAVVWDVECTASGGCPNWAWGKVAAMGAVTALVVAAVVRTTVAFYRRKASDGKDAAPDVLHEAAARRRAAMDAVIASLMPLPKNNTAA